MKKNSGQVMILTVLALGGTILGAATVASLLVVYQIRQSTDSANSAKAVFAADSGIEWALYNSFKNTGNPMTPPPFTEQGHLQGVSVQVTCFDGTNAQIDCNTTSTSFIRSTGTSGDTSRSFGLSL